MEKKKKRKAVREWAWGYVMIAPLTLGMAVFYIYPVIKVLFDSFREVGAFNQGKWIGIRNYQELLQDPLMWRALGNTLKYVVIIVPGILFLALLLACLLNMKLKGRSVFRVIYFLPSITMGAAVAMIWSWIYNGDFGILNQLLMLLGMERVRFLGDPQTALFAVCVVSIWCSTGYNMIILLAGIQGISGTYYDAAAIDGAGGIRRFFCITLPMVTPTLFFVMITTLISTFQTFDIIYMMVPDTSMAAESTQSLVVYFYRNAFEFSRKGYASAIAVFLFLIILVITMIQMKVQKYWVNYDE